MTWLWSLFMKLVGMKLFGWLLKLLLKWKLKRWIG